MYPIVLYAGQVVVLLLGDHEGGQVGGIGGQEDEGEERPDVGEEFAGDATRRVGGHSRSEQHGPHQPECPKQRKPVLCHTTIVRLKMMKKRIADTENENIGIKMTTEINYAYQKCWPLISAVVKYVCWMFTRTFDKR